MHHLLFRWITCIALMLCSVASARAAEVLIVSGERNPSYAAVVDAWLAQWERFGRSRTDAVQWVASESGSSEPLTLSGAKVVVTLGTDALRMALDRDLRAPIVAAMIPRSSFERVMKESGKRGGGSVSALYLDQPFGRQLDLLRLALPQTKRVGVLWGAESIALQSTLNTAAQSHGMQVVAGQVVHGSTLPSGLRAAMEDVDVLLAVADPAVFNSSTISNILLATYRARIPVMAFSPAYVKAGALLSVSSSSAQVGAQVAEMTLQLVQGGGLPAAQFPADFVVSVNEHVARSMGFALDATTLADQLRRMERRP